VDAGKTREKLLEWVMIADVTLNTNMKTCFWRKSHCLK